MQKEKRVKDLVTPLATYPHLPYWATLKEALIQLSSALEDGINTVLVFNEAYRLVGILSPVDMLRGIEPKFTHHYKKGGVISWSELFAEKNIKRMMQPIKDFMGPAKVIIDANEGIVKASHIMLMGNQQILPVQEKEKIIGVIKLDDILREMVEFLIHRE